jgi:P4 family phage/plasmid primase-like protien
MARRCYTAEDRWDSPHYLSFENGVLDTRDNQFHPHNPDFFCTTTLPYDYDPSAGCPTWLNYLHQATGGDTKLQVLLQAWCKWAIVPKDRARKSPVEKSLDLVGRKGSGKGTFLDILIALVGENNIGSAAPETFASPEGLGQLIDKRLAIDTDVSGYMQGVGNFNKVVSNEPVGIKKLFKDKSMQRLGVVVVRSYNDFISVPSSGTEGLDRRLCIVPFKCPPAVPDHDLDIKLRAELPGIFAWAWGLSLAQAQAVIRWSGAIEAVQEVSIERFLNDHPEVKYLIDDYPVGKEAVQAYDLYEGYVSWAKRNGHKACSNTKFGTLLNELGLVHFKGNGGVIFYHVPDMRNEFDLAAYLRISPKSTGDFPSELLQKSNFSSVQQALNPEPERRSEGSEGCVSDPPKNEPLPERVSEGSEGSEGLATSPTIQKNSDQPLRRHVGIMAGATVYRHGGWKLPKPTLNSLLGQDAIPLGAMPDWFQTELSEGSWEIIGKSGDDSRTKLMNKQTGRVVMVESVGVYEVQIQDKARA